MAVIKVGHVALTVTDLDEAIRHYTEVVGLAVTTRRDREAYLRAPGDQDHHCIALHASDDARLLGVGLKLGSASDLEELEIAAGKAGATVRRISAGERVGIGEAVTFGLPSGQQVWAYHEVQNLGWAEGMQNPDPVAPDTTAGSLRGQRLDHIALGAPDTGDVHQFMTEVLDFQSAELLVGPDGRPAGAWMCCGNTLHDIAFIPGPPGSFHHAAFYAENQQSVISAPDLLRHRNVPVFAPGVSRHGVGGSNTTYFYDPSGHRNELFASPYVTHGAPGKIPAVEWSMNDFGRAVFYFENELDMAFLQATT